MILSMSSVLISILRFLVHPVFGNVSVVELFVIIACIVAGIGVVVNGIDVRQEIGRARKNNGAKLTLTLGAWRRVIADSTVVVAFALLGILTASVPASDDDNLRVRSAIFTLLILVPLLAKVYNQVNDFLTRRRASKQLDELYNQLHSQLHTIRERRTRR